MANPFFSGRIPQDLLDRVEQYVRETGQSKTDVLIQALSVYLNHPVTKLAPTITGSEIEERFKSMESRITALELEVLLSKTSDKEFVIKTDNNKQESITLSSDHDDLIDNRNLIIEQDLLQEDADNKNDNDLSHIVEKIESPSIEDFVSDNTLDNKDDNEETRAENQENLSVEQQTDILTKNLCTTKRFESLSSVEFAQVTGIERRFLDDQRVKIRNKYRKLGRQILEKQLLQQPEEIPFKKKPLLISGYPYDLFFLGQDESGNNLWTAIPFDNERYHQLSIKVNSEENLN